MKIRVHDGPESLEKALLDVVRRCPDLVVLCWGYKRILSREFLQACSAPVFNSHPSLLPAFPGWDQRVHHEVFQRALWTGVSAHFVNEDLDAGPLIEQLCLPITRTMESAQALREAVKELEVKMWVSLLPRLLNSKWTGQDRLETTRAIQARIEFVNRS
jgi:phosphoribosylglycinamide formyltransferase-1